MLLRNRIQVESAPAFVPRKAGEGGEDDFGTLRPLQNKKEVKVSAKPKVAAEPVKTDAARVKTIPIDFRFTDSHRGERDSRGGRGGPRGRGSRGGAAPRGGAGGFERGAATRGTGGFERGAAPRGAGGAPRTRAPASSAFNPSDDSAFPALGAH